MKISTFLILMISINMMCAIIAENPAIGEETATLKRQISWNTTQITNNTFGSDALTEGGGSTDSDNFDFTWGNLWNWGREGGKFIASTLNPWSLTTSDLADTNQNDRYITLMGTFVYLIIVIRFILLGIAVVMAYNFIKNKSSET